MISFLHITSQLAIHGQPVQRSTLSSAYEKNGHCKRHFFREKSQEKSVPFLSLSISSGQLSETNPSNLGALQWKRLIPYFLAGCLSPAEPHSLLPVACARLEPSSLVDDGCNSRARQQSISKSGNGLHFSLMVLTCELSREPSGYHGE